MESLYDFLNWAWARHHNPLSWYIRPFFVLPFCYFAYKKSLSGIVISIAAVASSMFWFPAPSEVDPRAAAFLAMERFYITAPWTATKWLATMLIPAWFFGLAWTFWHRSWIAGLVVLNAGVLLKLIWSFFFGGSTAWSIVPPVAIGLVICNLSLLLAYRRLAPRHG